MTHAMVVTLFTQPDKDCLLCYLVLLYTVQNNVRAINWRLVLTVLCYNAIKICCIMYVYNYIIIYIYIYDLCYSMICIIIPHTARWFDAVISIDASYTYIYIYML